MSKITRLEQLANENSLYRVSGVFEKSEVCTILHRDDTVLFRALLPRPSRSYKILDTVKLIGGVSNGSISIMCLQRGE